MSLRGKLRALRSNQKIKQVFSEATFRFVFYILNPITKLKIASSVRKAGLPRNDNSAYLFQSPIFVSYKSFHRGLLYSIK